MNRPHKILSHPTSSGQSDKIKNATHSRHTFRSRVNRSVRERWENLSEMGHLSHTYPCTFTNPPQGTDLGIQVRACQQHVCVTASCGLSGAWFCLISLLHEALHTSVGSKCTVASTWCFHCDRATWDVDTISLVHRHTHTCIDWCRGV